MAFTKEKATTAVQVGDLELRIYNPDPTGGEAKAIYAVVHVLMSDNSERERRVDLSDILTAQQITQLNNLGDNLRTQAVSALLP